MFSVVVPLTITASDVTTFAPELAAAPAVPTAQITQFIGWANGEIGVDRYGQVQADRAGLYLVAHLGTLYKRAQTGAGGGAVGPVSQVTIGPVSKTFATAQTGGTSPLSQIALSQTAYGLEYLRLVKLFAPRMAVL